MSVTPVLAIQVILVHYTTCQCIKRQIPLTFINVKDPYQLNPPYWYIYISYSYIYIYIFVLKIWKNTTLCDKVYQWLAAGRWFSLGTPVSSTNKTDRNNITEILLKVALNTINHKTTLISHESLTILIYLSLHHTGT